VTFNKEQYELPEDDLKMDRNLLERFECFNAAILDEYITIYSCCISWYMTFNTFLDLTLSVLMLRIFNYGITWKTNKFSHMNHQAVVYHNIPLHAETFCKTIAWFRSMAVRMI
jgi:hypothetical protein